MKHAIYTFKNDITLASIRCTVKHMVSTRNITTKEGKDLLNGIIPQSKNGWYIIL